MDNHGLQVSRRWWAWIAGGLVVLLIGYRLVHRPAGDSASAVGAANGGQHTAIPIAVGTARTGDLRRYLTALGTVTAFNTATIKTRVDGEIVAVDFIEGQFVHKGDLLIQIDPRPYEAALEQAKGQLAKDSASLEYARVTLKRDEDLYKQAVISSDQRDSQQSTVGQDEGAIVADQANIDTAQLNVTYSHITAPFNGRIGLRLVDPGNIVHATDTTGLAVITQIEPIAVIFSIPEDNLPEVLKSMRANGTLEVDAYDRELTNKLATGTLLTTDNEIDTSTGTIKLKASFPNTDHALFPNQFVNAKLLVETLHNMVLVPTAAVQTNQLGSFVYVVQQNNTVDSRQVTIAGTQGDDTAVTSGVKNGEYVVVDGLDRLQPGSHVVIASAGGKKNPQQ
ncbi:MAG TPA: MdtA/MuxA family multidrug efflux RND transporter periplasmic adaptor subunit [Candidatus Binataceae bacterium]|nr:MdtA/MuxA family multidrug efflux RND transporter periplasmic adaptor subunit [Candidatus Binataceae bacterium]